MKDSEVIELIHGVGPSRAAERREHGLDTLGTIASAEPSLLAVITGIEHETATEMRRSAARLIGDAGGDDVAMDFGNPHEVLVRLGTVERLQIGADAEGEIGGEGVPQARFRRIPAAPSVGEAIGFHASSTVGEIDTYAWDLDFDGRFTADVEFVEPVVTRTFEVAGNREVALAVTDHSGRTDQMSRAVTVGLPEVGEAAVFPLETDQDEDLGMLLRIADSAQQFTADTTLSPGEEISIVLTDFPGGIDLRSRRRLIPDDGRVSGTFNLSSFDAGTYFVEARQDRAVLGRQTVAVRIVPEIEDTDDA